MFTAVQIAGKYSQIAVFVAQYFTYLTTHIMYAVFFYSSALELIKAFARSTHINIENSYVYIRIFFANIHCVFSVIHTANFGAISFTAFSSITATNAGNDYYALRFFTGFRANKMTFSRTSSVSQAFQLHGSNNIFATTITKFAVFF